MAKKKKFSSDPTPVGQPDGEKTESGFDVSEEKAIDETPLQAPDEAAASASEDQNTSDTESLDDLRASLHEQQEADKHHVKDEPKITANVLSNIEVEPFEPPHSQSTAENEQPAALGDDGVKEEIEETQVETKTEPAPIDDIRRSLKDEEQQKRSEGLTQRFSNWWTRTFPANAGKSKDIAGLNTRLSEEAISRQPKPASGQPNIDEGYVEEFLSELETLSKSDAESQKADASAEPSLNVAESEVKAPVVQEIPEAAKSGREVLAKSRDEEKSAEQYENLRAAALEGYEVSPEQPATQTTLNQTVRRTLRDLRPSDKRWLAAGFIAIVALILIAGVFAIITSLPTTNVPLTPAATSSVPFPIALNLPGGWNFYLAKGQLRNGTWTPQGAEWLAGTEISRWVSLPWSVQLEAVLRTLKAGDVLDLVMSNSDHLKYKVQSIQKVNADQMNGFDKNVPSLLVILSNKDSNERWVITAIP